MLVLQAYVAVVFAAWLGNVAVVLAGMLAVTRLLMLLTWPWRKRLWTAVAIDLAGAALAFHAVGMNFWSLQWPGFVVPFGPHLLAAAIVVPAMGVILFVDLGTASRRQAAH